VAQRIAHTFAEVVPTKRNQSKHDLPVAAHPRVSFGESAQVRRIVVTTSISTLGQCARTRLQSDRD
jgi:hypothetical protein